MTIFQLLFSSQGRISRSTFWLTTLSFTGISVFMIMMDVYFGTHGVTDDRGIFSLIFSIFSIYPTTVVTIKRCHDTDKSGWFLLFGLIPLINLLFFIEIGFVKGTTGDNKYGPDPISQVIADAR